ncbi:hypothetical protein [Bernardetia sp.]|uniref:hypothetical protein n=1 Tax=Bernardetia sp. TaxID=1937974 RepID=UPI0025BD389A|nr:hypothetical protein [Bernardetia sp.]
MSDNTIKILVILIITTIFCGIIGTAGYLFYTTYKTETICSDYTSGNTEAVKKQILDESISVDYGCPYPFLAYSSKIGDIDMVKFLIENNAEIEKRFTFKNPKTYPYKVVHTPLFYAIYEKYEQKKIDFPMEINENYIACLELLIKNGASLDTPCGREYEENASDSLKTVFRNESPDKQTAREIIKLIDNKMLNNFAAKY